MRFMSESILKLSMLVRVYKRIYVIGYTKSNTIPFDCQEVIYLTCSKRSNKGFHRVIGPDIR